MHFCFDKNLQEGVPATVQWSKDLALPQLWCRAQLWLGFDPCPRNFNTLQLQPKKKKKKKNLQLIRAPISLTMLLAGSIVL